MVVKLPARLILGLSVALQQCMVDVSMRDAGQLVSLGVSSQPGSCLTALSNYSGWCYDCRDSMLTAPYVPGNMPLHAWASITARGA